MSYKLYLDDVRDPNRDWDRDNYLCGTNDPNPDPWVVVKTVEEFIATIQERGVPDAVSLDYSLDQALDGLDALQWMIDNDIKPKDITIHSRHPWGAEKMQTLLNSWKKEDV